MKKYNYVIRRLILPALLFCTISMATAACSKPASSPSPTAPTESAAVAPTATSVATPTATPAPTTTVTPEPTATSAPTPTVTPEPTATPVPTPTVTPEPTATPAPTPTAAPKATATPTPAKKPTKAPEIYAANGNVKNLPKFSGYSYAIADAETGETLLSYNGEKIIYPASTIKQLTAMTALDAADPDLLLTTKQAILDDVDWDVWVMDVPADTTYSLEVWLNLMLIQSYGDVADTIADELGGSIKKFVSLMNQKAEALNLENTVVDNPIGLDISNDFDFTYTTANDMMKLTLETLNYPLIQKIMQKAEYLVPASGTVEEHTIKNSNQLLSKSDTYHSDVFTTLGGKTGSTDDAGKCLAVIVKSKKTGHRYACVYYGAPDNRTMYKEIVGLLEYVIKTYE